MKQSVRMSGGRVRMLDQMDLRVLKSVVCGRLRREVAGSGRLFGPCLAAGSIDVRVADKHALLDRIGRQTMRADEDDRRQEG